MKSENIHFDVCRQLLLLPTMATLSLAVLGVVSVIGLSRQHTAMDNIYTEVL